MATLGAAFLIEVDGIRVVREVLGRSVTVKRGDIYGHRIDLPEAENRRWPIDPLVNGLAITMVVSEGTDQDERTYRPTLAYLTSGDDFEVRILAVTVNKKSDISARTIEEARLNKRAAEAEFFLMRSYALDAAREFCDAVRLSGQPWIAPSANLPRVLNAPRLIDVEAGVTFGFRIGGPLTVIRIVGESGVLSGDALAGIESQLRTRELDVGARLVSEALYLAQSEQQSGPGQATLLAAMGVEIHTKATLRRISNDTQLPLLELLLSNPHDWSLAAHALFRKALPLVLGRDLGDAHRQLSKRIQELFEARNSVVHRGDQVDNAAARLHADTARAALDYLDNIAGTAAPTA